MHLVYECVKRLWMPVVIQRQWHDTLLDILQNAKYLVLIKCIAFLLPFFLFAFYLYCPLFPPFSSPLPSTSSISWPAKLSYHNLRGVELRLHNSWWSYVCARALACVFRDSHRTTSAGRQFVKCTSVWRWSEAMTQCRTIVVMKSELALTSDTSLHICVCYRYCLII
jgi:hypothetical protein